MAYDQQTLGAGEARLVETLMLCERMGWPLEYVEAMDAETYLRTITVLDAVDRGRAQKQKRAARR